MCPFINFCNSSNVYYKLLVPAQVEVGFLAVLIASDVF